MSIESTREVMERFFNAKHGDVSMLAEDVVFTLMASGQESRGREAVQRMFGYLYHIAFDATAVPMMTLFGEDHAVLEAVFTGRHIGEFDGIPATKRDVKVPMCVVYDLAEDQINAARIYFEGPALLQQLGVASAQPGIPRRRAGWPS